MSSEESRGPQGLKPRHFFEALAARLEARALPENLHEADLSLAADPCSSLITHCSLCEKRNGPKARAAQVLVHPVKVSLIIVGLTRAIKKLLAVSDEL